MNTAAVAALTLTVVAASPALAQPAGEPVDTIVTPAESLQHPVDGVLGPRTARRHRRMALEALAIQSIGTAWYWRNTGDGWGQANVPDWQLGFEGSALTKKLAFGRDGWRFDGNAFALNAICHPAFGALTYWSARKNNYGVLEAFAISTLVSGTWELFTEWAEYGSINDALSTSTTGIPLGEAAYQLMHHWRRARYAVTAGAGTQNGEALMSLGARVALDTTGADEDGMIVGGRKISVALELPFDGGVRAVEGGAKTSLVGYVKNTESMRLFAGASVEFYYRDQQQRDGRDWDLLATVNAGPTIDVQVRRGDVTLDVGADAYVDFGMLKAAAYDSWRQGNSMDVVRNTMQDKARPYYYARGFTVDPRVSVAYRGVSAGVKLALSAYDSLDGADRDQEMMTADPHIQDVDTAGEAWVGYTRQRLTVAIDARINKRTGTMADARGDMSASTTMLTLSYQR